MRRIVAAATAVLLVLFGTLVASAQDCATEVCTYVPILRVSEPQPTATATIAPTTAPSGVFILNNPTSYVDITGALHIIGEVQNQTTQVITFVRINANFFNGAQLVATDFTYASLDQLRPNDRTCFDVLVLDPPQYTTYVFEVPTYSTNTAELPTLTVLGASSSIDSIGSYHVIGQVRNDTGKPVKFVQPIGTLYDSASRAVGCDFTFVNSTDLAIGQTSAFDLGFIGRESYTDVTSYRLQVDGDVQ
jgi:hypothetical protein